LERQRTIDGTSYTNEVWATRKEGEEYAKRNKFKKSVKWKVLWYDKKYRIYENKTNQTSISS
jgi:hypothetical protein